MASYYLKIAFALYIGFLLPTVALAESYSCKFDISPARHYIPAQIDVEIMGKYAEVEISGAMISKHHGRWIEGKLETSNKIRVTTSWQLRDIDRDPLEFRNGNPSYLYTLTIWKSNMTAAIRLVELAPINSFDHSYRSGGKCAQK